MKDIKSYVIGFLTCACLFLIMGQTKNDSQIGRYQAYYSNGLGSILIDTKTGESFVYGLMTGGKKKKAWKKANNIDKSVNRYWQKSVLPLNSPLPNF